MKILTTRNLDDPHPATENDGSTSNAALYPGARWTAVRDTDRMLLTPISQPQKAVTAGALAGLLVASLATRVGGPPAGRLARPLAGCCAAISATS